MVETEVERGAEGEVPVTICAECKHVQPDEDYLQWKCGANPVPARRDSVTGEEIPGVLYVCVLKNPGNRDCGDFEPSGTVARYEPPRRVSWIARLTSALARGGRP